MLEVGGEARSFGRGLLGEKVAMRKKRELLKGKYNRGRYISERSGSRVLGESSHWDVVSWSRLGHMHASEEVLGRTTLSFVEQSDEIDSGRLKSARQRILTF
jgi:hypothetical protein